MKLAGARKILIGGLAVILLLVLAVAVWWRSSGETRESAFANPEAPLSMAEMAMGGESGPFYPAAVHTRNGALLPQETFTGSESCRECHAEIVEQWSSSPHRFSGLDNPWYRVSWEQVREDRGPQAARWCAGCHTPALLVAGAADGDVAGLLEAPAAETGVSCLVCHGISRVGSTLGQGHYELHVPSRHAMATHPNGLVRGFSVSDLPAAEFCSTCHKAALDEPMSGHPYLNVLDEYLPWQVSSASGNGMMQSYYFPEPRNCVDCHMPRPAGGADHRFASTNTALPTFNDDAAQLQAVIDSLRSGFVSIDLFAMSEGIPSANLDTSRPQKVYAPLNRVPATVRRGESNRVDVVLRNRSVGHLFPGGKNVQLDCWYELKATDENGKVIFWRGRTEPGEPVDPGTRFLGDVWIDESSERVPGYEFWKNRTDVSRQRLIAYGALLARFRVDIPPETGNELTLAVRLNYRRFRPEFTRRVFDRLGREGVEVPIVTLAEDSLTLRVVDAGAELPDMETAEAHPDADYERWNDYAYALAISGDVRSSLGAFQRLLALKPDYGLAHASLGNLQRLLGNFSGARQHLDQALALDANPGLVNFLFGMIAQGEANYEDAISRMRRAAEQYPEDSRVWKELGTTLLRNSSYEEAIQAFERSLAITPEDNSVHLSLALAYDSLGESQRAEGHRGLNQRFLGDPSANSLVGLFLTSDPHARSLRPLYEFSSMPLDEEPAQSP
jgi:tetratricopeptide (TPR) repeat protein